jgi:uncharacterized protein YndB with AHSA1/START domain
MSKLHIVAAPGDRAVEFTRAFRAPRQLVFDAHTRPELLRQWMLGPDGWEMPVCEIDLRPGGKFRYVWRKPDTGEELLMVGVFREIDAPARVVHNENFVAEWAGEPTLVTTTFTEKAGVTTMHLRVEFDSPTSRDAALATGMSDGMEIGYIRLDAMFAAQVGAG